MTAEHVNSSVVRLAEGFHALLDEYNHLLARSQTLEQSLIEVKSQFQSFVSDRGTVSAADVKDFEICRLPQDIETPLRRPPLSGKWWMRTDLPISKRHLLRTRYAVDAVHTLGLERAGTEDAVSKISSEAVVNGSSNMPSITESPLEQDFTIPGTPSNLQCPFASMPSGKLSAHAASVVSKYKSNGSMTPRSAASRISGRAHRPSDPLESTAGIDQRSSITSPTKAATDIEASIQGSGPVCPIRFLEKKSPEEVADYFEKHKHELPRSHEICVKRFGSSEASARQLDAKYGNLVGMIQNLGKKHAPMLPQNEHEDAGPNSDEAERVRQWADDVGNVDKAEDTAANGEERVSHFDRPLKDVRVGESPSRPWGIQVPLSALEKVDAKNEATPAADPGDEQAEETSVKKCPFAHGAPPGTINPHVTTTTNETATVPTDAVPVGDKAARAVFAEPMNKPGPSVVQAGAGMTFTGPVFIGLDPEQAAAVLQALELGKAKA